MKQYWRVLFVFLAPSLFPLLLSSQGKPELNKFRQLKQELATPNIYRNGAGAPGHKYFQQQADYKMDIEVDDQKQRLSGTETITYYNNSPDVLDYLWLQLDQNMRAENSDARKIQTGTIRDNMSFNDLKRMHEEFDGGFKLEYVRDVKSHALKYTVNGTMMRIDLDKPLRPGEKYTFSIRWWYNINDRAKIGGRSGYEYFPEEENYLYTIAQFYPRMCTYTDLEGWQNKQFLGRGEFALTFGDYEVNITVPSDHVVAATGELQNASSILSAKQRSRWEEAKKSLEKPVMIVTPDEALAAEKEKASGKKTWRFKADNVRDFAFASSRKFIWDAMGVKFGDRTVMAMSYYPKEGNPLWERYSTLVVAHTLRVYSRHTFDYPYPVAISVHTNRIGMEYPMICFNGGRPEADGTYSPRQKYGMVSVIIHEVGHNYFPMIVNSDERQWTWMDEGLNTFLQYLAEQEWERGYPSRRGPAYKIADYMNSAPERLSPIMTNSESIWQFGNNAYGKPATALNILRETVMGRELFDHAFKTYAQRWMFRHPSPADLFRTMEDASGVDLDWFWRGWFFTTEKVDISLDDVKWFRLDTKNPEKEKAIAAAEADSKPEFIGDTRNKESISKTMDEKYPELQDFYTSYNPFEVTAMDKANYERYLAALDEKERALLELGYNYYEITCSNKGGLVMPVILEFEYTDGSKEVHRIPVEIWRVDNKQFSKIFFTKKALKSVKLDPFLETADVDTYNNSYPRQQRKSRFELFKERRGLNPMQLQKKMDRMEKGE